MLLDLLFAVFLCFALYRGYQKGLVVGLFSLVAVIIGLAAALKLSAIVASYLGKKVNVSEEWLPLLSFVLVFVGVVLLVRLGAKAIERTVELVLLGWLNKLGGMILYVAIYTIIFSVLLFYAEQMKLIPPETIRSSQAYSFVQPIGPRVINGLGSIIPIFKNIFAELENFFESISTHIASP